MQMLLALVLNAVALIVTAYVVPGFKVADFTTAVFASVILGAVNTFVKPALSYVSAPLNVITLGLFTFIINAAVLLLVSAVIPGLQISGLVAAILGAVVLSVVSTILSSVLGDVAKIGKKK